MHYKVMRNIIRHACEQCGVPELSEENQIVIAFFDGFAGTLADAELISGRGFIRLCARTWPSMSHRQQVELLIHEACHVIADYRYGHYKKYTSHGPHWRLLMRCAGVPDPRSSIDLRH